MCRLSFARTFGQQLEIMAYRARRFTLGREPVFETLPGYNPRLPTAKCGTAASGSDVSRLDVWLDVPDVPDVL
jgi:hypothetical protein